ncbi:aspartate/glutamate racemase family protein [Clostridioides difficile]|uniref:aspartate/glutamate racemase family protein n=1 Tax=Clostridioides difficile TaxID=1496 RepID=UPI000BB1F14B|nr:aspartate/glutamate racemase family protein [Clostridioides difficile]EIS9523591.1 aspartate/glutamate racemase family protein [Clostridioides difficile]EIS9526201.1 aspartate/glutamate racemase family protein [Clostridioides difficile]EIS9625309.1 aspartate/glutamate racemase family protein [Clostridioides difficile]EIS9627693.1 aspartate/glutamate racemase family protein [Clostridioides difficile]MBY2429769.1 aspartate/glutamate racemase family protein [Clostridioides difficile]
MKTIGLIGGMSWESTITYYQVINTVIKERLGGLHSSKCILYSVDFQEIEECQSSGNWEKSAKILADAAIKLQEAGANFIVICTNTMHKVSDKIQESIHIPLLHIADVTATVLREKEIKKVALLGTKYTMEQDFYKNVIINNGIEVLIPNEEDRIIVNDTIFNELCLGIVSESSKKAFLSIIDNLGKQGAEGVILGCTEIGLLIKQNDTSIPLFD